jgi:NAD(P)-dependent dehydrogenase (short-subunit alcohol dehydrogenase family)
VTDAEQIANAVRQIRDLTGEAGLNGIVNNAGIAVAGPLECIPMAAIERQFEVNVFGLIAVTQAFLPLIRMAPDGRIVLVGSNSGYLCKPFSAPYGASKHAIEAIADSLRVELHSFGIRVALIQPGATQTRIWEKAQSAADQIFSALPPQWEALYGKPIAAMRRLTREIPKRGIPPERIARVVAHALESPRPKTRYRVGLDARAAYLLARFLPTRLRDLLLRRVMDLT